MKRMVVWVMIGMCCAAGLSAGEVYTLDECIEMALAKDPNLVQFRNSVKLASATVWQQAGNFLPDIGVSYSQTQYNRGPLSPQFRYVEELGQEINVADSNSIVNKSYSAGISMQMTLFNGFSNVWNYLGSKASKRKTEYDLASAKSDLVFLIKGNYYLVLKAKRDLDVAREAMGRSEELLKLFEEKYELGSASLSEVLKQKVQYGNDKLAVVSAEKTLEVYFDNLALNIGINPQTDFDIAGVEMEREPVGDLAELTNKAVREHPSITSAEENISAYKYDVRSAWGWYLPVVTGSFSYGWSKDQFSEIVKLGPFDHSATLRLSVGLTLFDGFTRERNLVRAKVGLNNAKAFHYYTRNQVVRDVEDAYLGIKLADETLAVTEETERAAAEDFDLVQEKYNLGAAALWELLDAQVSLREAQFNKVKAEFDYNLAVAQLQNAMGN